MENSKNKDLEKALSGLGNNNSIKKENTSSKSPQMSKEQEIGFHQGALNTLMSERNEFVKMIGNVEGIMQAHLKRLEELGVKIQTQKRE